MAPTPLKGRAYDEATHFGARAARKERCSDIGATYCAAAGAWERPAKERVARTQLRLTEGESLPPAGSDIHRRPNPTPEVLS